MATVSCPADVAAGLQVSHPMRAEVSYVRQGVAIVSESRPYRPCAVGVLSVSSKVLRRQCGPVKRRTLDVPAVEVSMDEEKLIRKAVAESVPSEGFLPE